MATQQRLPTGTGTQSEWTAFNGGTKWSEVDDPIGTPDDATTYILSTTNNDDEFFTFTAFDIASSAIASVKMYFRGQRTAAGACNIRAELVVGGTIYLGTSQAMTTSWANYSETWLVNPATGLAWTEADVEGTGANPLQQFKVKALGIAAGEEVQCTQCYIEVDYTPAATGNPKGPLSNPFMGPFGGPI